MQRRIWLSLMENLMATLPAPSTPSPLSETERFDPTKNPQLGLLRMQTLRIEIRQITQKLLSKADLGEKENLRLYRRKTTLLAELQELKHAWKPRIATTT
jgi:hypothetical protein